MPSPQELLKVELKKLARAHFEERYAGFRWNNDLELMVELISIALTFYNENTTQGFVDALSKVSSKAPTAGEVALEVVRILDMRSTLDIETRGLPGAQNTTPNLPGFIPRSLQNRDKH